MSNEAQKNLFFRNRVSPLSAMFLAFFLLKIGTAWAEEAVHVNADTCAAWGMGQAADLQIVTVADKDGEEDEDEIEVVIDGLPLHAPPQAPPSALDCLCRQQLRDDHGDVFPCSTPLEAGQLISGQLDAFTGDRRDSDRDLFVLPLWGRDGGEVLVRWSWSVDVAAGLRLLDASGRPQAVFRGGVSVEGAISSHPQVEQQRLRLPSGLYFLEIRSTSLQEGAYAMMIDILD